MTPASGATSKMKATLYFCNHFGLVVFLINQTPWKLPSKINKGDSPPFEWKITPKNISRADSPPPKKKSKP